MTQFNVGIAGVGIGKEHIEAYRQLPEMFTVTAVTAATPAEAQKTAAAYQIPHAVANFDALCAHDDIDIINICTPNHLHLPQALQALAAGKHVVIEKPVAGSLADIDRLMQAEADSDKCVMPIFQYRFGRGLQKLKALQAAGLIGKAHLTTVETMWRRRADYYARPWRGKWRTEMGGALVTLAIHAHDMLCYVVGPPQRVMARLKTAVNPIETEDTVAAVLEMTDGSLATLAVTTGSSKEISRHRFCFENLTAESSTGPYTNSADPWQFYGDTPELQAQIEAVLANFRPLPERFAGQFYHFHRSLMQNTGLPVTLADARQSTELLTALYYAARTETDVTLPITPDHPLYYGWQPKTKGDL
jgi:predicted dehydrogenase